MLETLRADSSQLPAIGSLTHAQAILALPHIDHDAAARAEDILRRRAGGDGLLVLIHDDARLGFIRVANFVFARSSSPFFGYLAQDAFPGEGWLGCGLTTLSRSGMDLLAFNDGRFHGTLAVFGLVRRSFSTALYHKSLFYPGYRSHFGDTELSAVAAARGRMVFNPACLLVEVDYAKHAKKNNPEDDALYRQRARTGFDGLAAPFEPSPGP